jgi:hypothetical protein
VTQNTAYKWQEMKNRRRVVGDARIELISPTTQSYRFDSLRRYGSGHRKRFKNHIDLI